MKIAIYGGSFNPIHNGHLNVIKSTLLSLSPDKLFVMPVGNPPHKSEDELIDSKERIKMAMIATKAFENVFVSNYEASKAEKSYTFETLEYFKTLYPDDQLYFLLGSDRLNIFLNWRGADKIMSMCELVGVCRSKGDYDVAKKAMEDIIRAGGRCRLINCEPVEASSTEIRKMIAMGKRPVGFVPKEVTDHIFEKGLYR